MNQVTYIPYMADHAVVLAGALRNHGISAQVLPPPDRVSLDLGLDMCKGRECLPCFLCAGDIVRTCRRPDFKAEESRFLLPTSPGPCRFGQYASLLRDILEQQGYGDVEIVSPTTENSYRGFGEHPAQLRFLAWQGFVTVDLMQKMLLQRRPYELVPGTADAIYARGIERAARDCEAGGGDALVAAVRQTAREFASVAVDDRERRPRIGVVGEIYVLLNVYSNQGIARRIESMGGEAIVANLTEWIHFSVWCRKFLANVKGDRKDLFGAWVVDAYQRTAERRLRKAAAPGLRDDPEPTMNQMMKSLDELYDPTLGTEATLSLGKALALAAEGASGILNVYPFSCMPGIIVSGMASAVRRRVDDLPWLDLSYDGQEDTNVGTRLEAFMHQVQQYERRRHQRLAPQPAPVTSYPGAEFLGF